MQLKKKKPCYILVVYIMLHNSGFIECTSSSGVGHYVDNIMFVFNDKGNYI